MTKPWEYK